MFPAGLDTYAPNKTQMCMLCAVKSLLALMRLPFIIKLLLALMRLPYHQIVARAHVPSNRCLRSCASLLPSKPCKSAVKPMLSHGTPLQVPPSTPLYRKAPLNYLSHLLGHEGAFVALPVAPAGP